MAPGDLRFTDRGWLSPSDMFSIFVNNRAFLSVSVPVPRERESDNSPCGLVSVLMSAAGVCCWRLLLRIIRIFSDERLHRCAAAARLTHAISRSRCFAVSLFRCSR